MSHQEKKIFQIKWKKKSSTPNRYVSCLFYINTYQQRTITYQEFHGWNRFELRGPRNFKIWLPWRIQDWSWTDSNRMKADLLYPKNHKLGSAGELTYGLTTCVLCPALQFALKKFEYKLKLFDILTYRLDGKNR